MPWQDHIDAANVEFTPEELRFIGRLAQNLLSCAVEAGLDSGVVESVYYKTQEYLDG